MNDPEDMEALAAQEHKSWAGWTKWMLSEIEKELQSKRPGSFAEAMMDDLAGDALGLLHSLDWCQALAAANGSLQPLSFMASPKRGDTIFRPESTL